jgi:hypothetical protein
MTLKLPIFYNAGISIQENLKYAENGNNQRFCGLQSKYTELTNFNILSFFLIVLFLPCGVEGFLLMNL